MSEPIRLDKLLVHMGYGTRKEIKKTLKKGLVTVDGELITNSAIKVNPTTQSIKFAGSKINYREFIYVMLNKPAGYISATEDDREKTVVELLSAKERAFKPFPVGRLDKDTEGLLLLTNDGKLAHNLTSPRKKVAKRYYALIKGEVNEEDQKAFRQGVVLDDGYQTLPTQLEIIKSAAKSEVEVVIYEGKYHQVKRMFLARGKKVLYLRRLAMGSLELDEQLAPGQYRELTDEELALLKT